jgi:hypothetical protein
VEAHGQHPRLEATSARSLPPVGESAGIRLLRFRSRFNQREVSAERAGGVGFAVTASYGY